MPTFRIKEAASLLGVSHDTLRRWAEAGRIATTTDDSGRMAVDGAALAQFAQELAESADSAGTRQRLMDWRLGGPVSGCFPPRVALAGSPGLQVLAHRLKDHVAPRIRRVLAAAATAP